MVSTLKGCQKTWVNLASQLGLASDAKLLTPLNRVLERFPLLRLAKQDALAARSG